MKAAKEKNSRKPTIAMLTTRRCRLLTRNNPDCALPHPNPFPAQ
jgi:hypothetical protein